MVFLLSRHHRSSYHPVLMTSLSRHHFPVFSVTRTHSLSARRGPGRSAQHRRPSDIESVEESNDDLVLRSSDFEGGSDEDDFDSEDDEDDDEDESDRMKHRRREREVAAMKAEEKQEKLERKQLEREKEEREKRKKTAAASSTSASAPRSPARAPVAPQPTNEYGFVLPTHSVRNPVNFYRNQV